MTDMIALPRTRMTVDEYLAWAQGQPGRYELLDGAKDRARFTMRAAEARPFSRAS
jgi:hypothetical protein